MPSHISLTLENTTLDPSPLHYSYTVADITANLKYFVLSYKVSIKKELSLWHRWLGRRRSLVTGRPALSIYTVPHGLLPVRLSTRFKLYRNRFRIARNKDPSWNSHSSSRRIIHPASGTQRRAIRTSSLHIQTPYSHLPDPKTSHRCPSKYIYRMPTYRPQSSYE